MKKDPAGHRKIATTSTCLNASRLKRETGDELSHRVQGLLATRRHGDGSSSRLGDRFFAVKSSRGNKRRLLHSYARLRAREKSRLRLPEQVAHEFDVRGGKTTRRRGGGPVFVQHTTVPNGDAAQVAFSARKHASTPSEKTTTSLHTRTLIAD